MAWILGRRAIAFVVRVVLSLLMRQMKCEAAILPTSCIRQDEVDEPQNILIVINAIVYLFCLIHKITHPQHKDTYHIPGSFLMIVEINHPWNTITR